MWYLLKAIFWVMCLYVFVIFPTCTVPGISSTSFCSTIMAPSPSASISTDNIYLRMACLLPSLSWVPLCGRSGALPTRHGAFSLDTKLPKFVDALPTSANRFSSLFTAIGGSNANLTSPGWVAQEILPSLDEIHAIIMGNSFSNKAAILSHLHGTRFLVKNSILSLQKYRVRLVSSLDLILSSSRFMTSLAQSPSSRLKRLVQEFFPFRCFQIPHRQEHLENAFLHSLKTYEVLNDTFAQVHRVTLEDLLFLDGALEILADLLYGDTLSDTKLEWAGISNSLWTVLGGNRGLLTDANTRIGLLDRSGRITRRLRTLIFDLQVRVENLHSTVNELQMKAADPLLIESPLPELEVIDALVLGCIQIRSSLVRFE